MIKTDELPDEQADTVSVILYYISLFVYKCGHLIGNMGKTVAELLITFAGQM